MHLCYPSDVLLSVLWREAEILVQPESYIVAVKSVAREAKVKKVLLQCYRNG